MPTRKNAVAKPKPNPFDPNALADQMAELSGVGLENTQPEDLLIPQLKIVQSGSQETKPRNSKYMEGAKEGDLIDSQMGINYGDQVEFLPVLFRKEWVEWFPRESNKGIARTHESSDILAQCKQSAENNAWYLPSGNQVVETYVFYGFILNEKYELHESFIAMSGMQLKKARKWISISNGLRAQDSKGNTFRPPMFYQSYFLGVQPEQNARGDWVGWVIAPGRTLGGIIQSSKGKIPADGLLENIKAFSETAKIRAATTALLESPENDSAEPGEGNADDIPM